VYTRKHQVPFAREKVEMLLNRVLLVALVSLSNISLAQDDIAQARPVGQSPTADATTPKARPLTVATELIGGTKITGTLVDTSALQMKTAFGEAQIPLSEIAGVRFASGDNSSTTVVMLNGDSITGATDLKYLTIETEWGTAKINGPSLLSMMFVPGLQWESVGGLSGKRWSLVEASAQPKSNRPPNTGGQPQNNLGGNVSSSGTVIGGSGSPFPPLASPSTVRQ
jgi:hypothetical protein